MVQILLIIGKKTEVYFKEKKERKVSLEYWLHYLFISYWVEKSKWEFAGLTTFYKLTNMYRRMKSNSVKQKYKEWTSIILYPCINTWMKSHCNCSGMSCLILKVTTWFRCEILFFKCSCRAQLDKFMGNLFLSPSSIIFRMGPRIFWKHLVI